MAKARITFTDTIGAATLESDYPEPACRFAGWTPLSAPQGDAAHVQSTAARTMDRTSWRYGASFNIRGLGMGAAAGSALDVADRLILHLLNGGSCAVHTEDELGAVYPTCGIMPGTEPRLTLSDARHIEYTLSLALINLAAVPVAMAAHYGASGTITTPCGGVAAGTLLAHDAFTGTTDSALSAHVPNVGGGSWSVDDTDWRIEFNHAVLKFGPNGRRFARMANDIADDSLEIRLDLERAATNHTNVHMGFWFLAAGTIGEGCALYVRTAGLFVDLIFERRDAAGVVQQSVEVTTGISAPVSSQFLRIGCEVCGLTVTPFTEPHGGGSRTTYTPIVLGADLRDGTHQKVGLTSENPNSDSGRIWGDNLVVRAY